MTPTVDDLIRELRGTVCRCSRPKQSRHTLCRACFVRLPAPLRTALYAPIGDGYEIAYDAAVLWLREHPALQPNEPPWPELLWPDLQEGLLRFLDPTRQARQELREALAEFRAAVREQVVLARSLPREPREQQP